MKDIAMGVKVFKRTNHLRRLLTSVPDEVPKVYVADDGETEERDELYDGSYPFSLEVLDLDYDAGMGLGRKRIVEAVIEDYILIVDPDHAIPDNIDVLRQQLKADDSLGGVGGTLVEPERDRVRFEAQDFRERDGALIRDPHHVDKSMELVANYPLIRFDFIPHAALFRRDCLEDYVWDEEYVTGQDHADFFVGHWRTTDWEFAVCPSVVFEHYPGGSQEYADNRHDDQRLADAEKYFLNKWGYEEDVVKGWNWDTMQNPQPGIKTRTVNVLREEGLGQLVKSATNKIF